MHPKGYHKKVYDGAYLTPHAFFSKNNGTFIRQIYVHVQPLWGASYEVKSDWNKQWRHTLHPAATLLVGANTQLSLANYDAHLRSQVSPIFSLSTILHKLTQELTLPLGIGFANHFFDFLLYLSLVINKIWMMICPYWSFINQGYISSFVINMLWTSNIFVVQSSSNMWVCPCVVHVPLCPHSKEEDSVATICSFDDEFHNLRVQTEADGQT